MKRQEFEVELIKDDKTSGLGIKIPFNVLETFGSKGRIKVKGTIDGHPYRGSIHPYGGIHYMGVKKEFREAIGKKQGDRVIVTMEVDMEPRTVEAPDDLVRAFDGNETAEAAFEKCSYTHKKEYVDWINEAKKPETRQRRIVKTLEKLVEK
jgi:hypothetical protein